MVGIPWGYFGAPEEDPQASMDLMTLFEAVSLSGTAPKTT